LMTAAQRQAARRQVPRRLPHCKSKKSSRSDEMQDTWSGRLVYHMSKNVSESVPSKSKYDSITGIFHEIFKLNARCCTSISRGPNRLLWIYERHDY
jgi:hypothetical protein